jgi:hypothetical protein
LEEDDEPLQLGRSVLGMSYENFAQQAQEILESIECSQSKNGRGLG